MRLTSSVAAVATLALIPLAGCSTEKPAGCTPVNAAVAQAIVDGSTGDLTLSAGSGRAIQVPSGVYYVAFNIKAAGEDDTGVWAVDDIAAPTELRAVDGFAHHFTSWPQIEGANGSKPMRDALACLDA